MAEVTDESCSHLTDLTVDEFVSGKFSENLLEQRDEILALQSIFNTGDDDRLKVLSEVTDDGRGVFILLITVCPKPVENTIQIELALPLAAEAEHNQTEAAAAPLAGLSPPAVAPQVQLNRSQSGWHWTGSVSVKYLSPIYLHVILPPSYPSQKPPRFHLSCDWLGRDQLTSLSQGLLALWTESCNMPIIYTWVDWAENNLFSHLNFVDKITLRPSMDEFKENEPELFPSIQELGEILSHIIRYDQQQRDIEFCKTTQVCHVCYCEKPGEQFFRLHDCQHHFCFDCMAQFCEMHVREGTVEALRCPDRGCQTIIPPYIVQAVVNPEAYQRWEQLLLQKTLDAMNDTVYCPRCRSLVIAEAEVDLHLARCTQCFFVFCTECKRVWHQGQQCTTDEEILEDLQKRARNVRSAEDLKFQELLRKAQEDISARKMIYKKARRCPRCKIPVEKIGGCNKMTCKCGQCFCWVCEKRINGYDHFTAGFCSLFPDAFPINQVGPPPEGALRVQAQLAVHPDLAGNQINCPSCKQLNLKGLDNNNHLRCWNCKANFCFMCKQRILGNVTEHFRGPCRQHS